MEMEMEIEGESAHLIGNLDKTRFIPARHANTLSSETAVSTNSR